MKVTTCNIINDKCGIMINIMWIKQFRKTQEEKAKSWEKAFMSLPK